MSNNSANPYTLEIAACERPAGHFTWALRRHGTPFQPAARLPTTEETAERGPPAAIQKLPNAHPR